MTTKKSNNVYMNNMTAGPILPVILTFALPMMLGNLFNDLYNLADLSIAGYTLGDNALAAISATSGIFSFINTTSRGFNIGTAICVSNAFGAGDLEKTRKSLAGMTVLCYLVTAFLTLLLLLFIQPLMRLTNTPAELFEEAWDYIIVIIWGLVFTMTYDFIACAFRALGNSRLPLLLLIICSVLNVLLDYLFMAVFGWGVMGAALATILSQAISAVCSAVFFLKLYPELHFRKEDFKGLSSELREMFPLGMSGSLTNSMYAIGWIFMQAALNSLGQDTLVAYAAYKKIQMFAIIPSIAVANSLATFSAQNYGAGKFSRITRGILIGCLFSLIINVFSFSVTFFLGEDIIRLITNTKSDTAIKQAFNMCLVTVSFIWAQTVIMSFRMSIQGMRKKIVPVLGTFLEFLIRTFFALVMVPRFGYIAIGWAESACWVLGGFMMIICYFIILKKEINRYESATAS